jgi:chromosome segregation ATPase
MLLNYYQQNLDASSTFCESIFSSLWAERVQSLMQNVNENTNLATVETAIESIYKLYIQRAKGPRKEIVYQECLKQKSDQILMLKSTLPNLQQKALDLSKMLNEEIQREQELAVQFENKKRELESQKNLLHSLQVRMKENEEQLKKDYEKRMRDSENKLRALHDTNARQEAANFQSVLNNLKAEHATRTQELIAANNWNANEIARLQSTIASLHPPQIVHGKLYLFFLSFE